MSEPHTSPSASQPGLGVAAIVQSKRKALGLSARALSTRAGLSTAYVTRLEAGDMEPSLRAFAALAVELRLTMQEVYFLVRSVAQHVRRANGE